MSVGQIVIIGNYKPDKQISMLQYADLLLSGLVEHGVNVLTVYPEERLGKLFSNNKWIGYLDKIILFRLRIKSIVTKLLGNDRKGIVHICDHSNSFYAHMIQDYPVVVTCHDLMAIRAANGEFENNSPMFSGKLLQKWIKHHLQFSDYYICDSKATQRDLHKVVPKSVNRSQVIYPGFYRNYNISNKNLSLSGIPLFNTDYILHVGSNAWYKNRLGVIKVYCQYKKEYGDQDLKCIFVGPQLDEEQVELLKENKLLDNTYVLSDVTHDDLLILYTFAKVLMFPSIYEGFGWPPLEAQSCDCPVISSSEGSLKEVVGDSGLVANWNDTASHVKHLNLVLSEQRTRQSLVKKGRANVTRFSNNKMVSELLKFYETVLKNRE